MAVTVRMRKPKILAGKEEFAETTFGELKVGDEFEQPSSPNRWLLGEAGVGARMIIGLSEKVRGTILFPNHYKPDTLVIRVTRSYLP